MLQVIGMLYDAQENSPSNLRVVEAINKVLEILQTTELFAPHIHQVKEEDPLTNDYVEGLCDVSHFLWCITYSQHHLLMFRSYRGLGFFLFITYAT